jgi:hypothetical protein
MNGKVRNVIYPWTQKAETSTRKQRKEQERGRVKEIARGGK